MEFIVGVLLWIANQGQYAAELKAAGMSDEEVAARLWDDASESVHNLWSVPQIPEWRLIQGFRFWRKFIKVRVQVPGTNPAEYVWIEELRYFAWQEVPGVAPPNNIISFNAATWERLMQIMSGLALIQPFQNPFQP